MGVSLGRLGARPTQSAYVFSSTGPEGYPFSDTFPDPGIDGFRKALNLNVLKAQVPAFFHEGYIIDSAPDDELYSAINGDNEEHGPGAFSGKERASRVRAVLGRRAGEVDVNAPLQCVPYTPLQVACEVGDIEVVKLLKERGANLNLMSEGYSPLVTAARHGHKEVVSYLLDIDAYIDQKAGHETIPSFITTTFVQDLRVRATPRGSWNNKTRVSRVLEELSDPYWGNTALIQACREHHVGIVKELLHKGADVNLKNTMGNTALHVACLSRTANIYTESSSSGTCSSSSVNVPSTVLIGGERDIVRLLLEHGADPSLRNGHGETALERSFRLLSSKSDPLSMHDWSFSDAEKVALLRRLLHVVRQLLVGGCDVRGCEQQGSTAQPGERSRGSRPGSRRTRGLAQPREGGGASVGGSGIGGASGGEGGGGGRRASDGGGGGPSAGGVGSSRRPSVGGETSKVYQGTTTVGRPTVTNQWNEVFNVTALPTSTTGPKRPTTGASATRTSHPNTPSSPAELNANTRLQQDPSFNTTNHSNTNQPNNPRFDCFDTRDVLWTVSQLVKVCELLMQVDKDGTLRTLYQDTVLLFYECVYISGQYFPWDELEAVVMWESEGMDEDFRARLLKINCRDFTLAQWCRITIRSCLRMPLCTQVRKLPVPLELQNYILFSDLDY